MEKDHNSDITKKWGVGEWIDREKHGLLPWCKEGSGVCAVCGAKREEASAWAFTKLELWLWHWRSKSESEESQTVLV